VRNYKVYGLDWKERFLCLGITIGLAGAISWLFYHNSAGMAVSVVLYFPVRRTLKRRLLQKRKGEILFQFKEILQMTVTALKAGYAMENAFVHAREEFVRLYGEKGIMAQEFAHINYQVKLNVPLEALLEDLATRCGIEEISSFSQVFGFAKRSGGDFLKIFQNSADKIRQKAEIKREIGVVIAAKRMEMNIMNLVPFGILAYVGITSPEFLEPLYGNWLGIGIMTAALLIYGCACMLAEKIVDIQV
jgi:tight adherence protein B